MGHGPHSSQIFVLFNILYVLCRSVYCLCVNVYCTTATPVGIATGYGLDGPGIESQCGRDFPPIQTRPGAHPASCTMGTGTFPGVKCGQGVLLTTHPLLAPRSLKSRAIPLPPLWATTGPVTGLLYLYLFMSQGQVEVAGF